MGKHAFFSPKAVSIRQKQKGLQKLRWYCQMCQKQCRDENGFKCHKTSEAHMRQMALYAGSAGKFSGEFSRAFHRQFLRIFQNQGGRRVKSNVVYRQLIKDKDHVHINSTCWSSLTGYVHYLGREGIAKVEEVDRPGTEWKDWWIEYIDRDPAVLRRQSKVKKVLAQEAKSRARANNRAEEQRMRAMAMAKPSTKVTEVKEFVPSDGPIKLTMKSSKPADSRKNETIQKAFSFNDDQVKRPSKKRKLAAYESLKTELESDKKKRKMIHEKREMRHEKQKETPRDLMQKTQWLVEGIVVKVLHKKLAQGKYHQKKGTVIAVMNGTGAKIKMKKTNDVIEIDQAFLQTVTPANGRPVRVLHGFYKRCAGTLKKINEKSYEGRIELGPGKVVEIPIEWFSKAAKQK